MGGRERKPSAWRSAVVRRSQANLPPVALQASREGDLRRWHTHGRALALTARVGELRPCGRVEGERRQLQGAHPAVRARAPSSARGVRAQVLHRPHVGSTCFAAAAECSDVGCGSWTSAAECRAAVGERWERIEVHRCCR